MTTQDIIVVNKQLKFFEKYAYVTNPASNADLYSFKHTCHSFSEKFPKTLWVLSLNNHQRKNGTPILAADYPTGLSKIELILLSDNISY